MINIYFMKPMLKLTSLLVVISSLFLVSCVKDLYDPNASNSNPDSDIPADFDFSTTKTVNLTVNVDDEYNNQYFYKVEVYDQNPFASDTVVNLLGGGVAKGSQPFVSQIVIPQSLNTIYVRQTDPLKRESVKAVDVATVTASSICDFKMAVTPATKSLESLPTLRADAVSSITANTYVLPSNVTKLDNKGADLSGGDYYIPFGTTVANKIKFNWNFVSSLYVEGEVSFKNINLPPDSKIIVLPKGKVTMSDTPNLQQEGIIIAVHSGGTFTSNGITLGKGSLMINDGTVSLTKKFEMNNTGKLYNNGSFSVTESIETSAVTDNTILVNNNQLSLSGSLKMSSEANLQNNGNLNIENEFTLVNSTNEIDNNNHINALYIGLTNGKLKNNCSISTEDLYLNGGTLVASPGSLTSCEDFFAGGSTITLNGDAILSIADITEHVDNQSKDVKNGFSIGWNSTIEGIASGSTYPLLKIAKINSIGSQALNLSGNLEACFITNQPTANNFLLTPGTGVNLTLVPQLSISSTTCNGNGVNGDPGTGIPSDPTFPIKIQESTSYTFAMEDRWPLLGDYDMNDLVFVVSEIVKNTNDQNMVGSMSFKVTPIAAGASLKSSAALQFDDIASGGISMTSTNSVGSIESGQSKANILLLPSINSLFGKSAPEIINTNLSQPKLAASTYTYTVSFTSPVSLDKVNINKLNFYLIVGGTESVNRTEIHLAGFTPSSKVKSVTNNYKDPNNMIWGIMLPIGNFKYPVESVKIEDAYPQFKSWATSAGANDKTWYLAPTTESGKVYTK